MGGRGWGGVVAVVGLAGSIHRSASLHRGGFGRRGIGHVGRFGGVTSAQLHALTVLLNVLLQRNRQKLQALDE